MFRCIMHEKTVITLVPGHTGSDPDQYFLILILAVLSDYDTFHVQILSMCTEERKQEISDNNGVAE